MELLYYAFDRLEVEVNNECAVGKVDESAIDFQFDAWVSDDHAYINYFLCIDVAKTKKAFASSPYRVNATFLVQIAFPQPDLFVDLTLDDSKKQMVFEGAVMAYSALRAALATVTKACLNGELLLPDLELAKFSRMES